MNDVTMVTCSVRNDTHVDIRDQHGNHLAMASGFHAPLALLMHTDCKANDLFKRAYIIHDEHMGKKMLF